MLNFSEQVEGVYGFVNALMTTDEEKNNMYCNIQYTEYNNTITVKATKK